MLARMAPLGKYLLLWWVISVPCTTVSGQIALDSLKQRLEVEISGTGIWHSKPVQGSRRILLPEYLRWRRMQYNPEFNRTWKYAEDNPLYHAAYYMQAHARLRLLRGMQLFFTLNGEHRGFSYGVNSTSNILVYPMVKFAFDRSFDLAGRLFRAKGSVGNQWNPRLYEGLTLYNLFQQGHNYSFRYGKFQLRYFQLNDLLNGIGLNIDETYDIVSSIEELSLGSDWKMDSRAGFGMWSMGDNQWDTHWDLSLGVYQKDVRWYAQFSQRTPEEGLWQASMIACMVGNRLEKKGATVEYKQVIEARYYAAGYNQSFVDVNVFYRRRGLPQNYANTVGSHFYPMQVFDRPFSQWAVFTEYQDSIGRDVMGASMWMQAKWKVHPEISIRATADLSMIGADQVAPYLYPFFEFGIGWEPVENNFLSVGITNKGLNLDVHYPTHYLYAQPAFVFRLQRDLKSSWFLGHEE